MRTFRTFAFVSTLASYLLIFTGGLVRVSGAGLGCPDWPKCFGRWIPPLSSSQLPADIDPNTFNFALAWIEYLNRVLGMALGILIVITAVLAIVHYRKVAHVLYPTLLSALLVAFVGWQGGKVVTSHLEPLAVSFHLLVALGVVCLMTYATQQAYYLAKGGTSSTNVSDKKIVLWTGALIAATVVQILFGTQVRATFETLESRFPLDNDLEIISKSGVFKYIHMIFGILVAMLSFQVGHLMLRAGARSVALTRVALWWMMALMVIQLLLGSGLLALGIPPLAQVFHLWVAALFIGAVLFLYSATRQPVRQA